MRSIPEEEATERAEDASKDIAGRQGDVVE